MAGRQARELRYQDESTLEQVPTEVANDPKALTLRQLGRQHKLQPYARQPAQSKIVVIFQGWSELLGGIQDDPPACTPGS